jgi:hypothetical protein
MAPKIDPGGTGWEGRWDERKMKKADHAGRPRRKSSACDARCQGNANVAFAVLG